jgi:Fic family protein
VDAFIVHYQFEAIHPFRDGNGRVGRLLLSATIAERCHLSAAWLHMSAYFDSHKDEYIDRLLRVSTDADWEGWISFCLRGVVEQAKDTEQRCERLLRLNHDYRQRLVEVGGNIRLSSIIDGLFEIPILQVGPLTRKYNITYPTARADVDRLLRTGIVREVEASSRKTYYCPDIFDIIYES